MSSKKFNRPDSALLFTDTFTNLERHNRRTFIVFCILIPHRFNLSFGLDMAKQREALAALHR